jgi:biopolymer transport protein ExbB
MVAIGLCSMLALTVIVERGVILRRRGIIPPHFLGSLKALAADQRRAMEFCQADDSPAAAVLAAVLRHRGKDAEKMEKAVRDAGSRVLVRLRRRMRLLSALPQVSTMLGLLGTIFGMIKTFQAVAASGQTLGKTELLAKGIFEAWANTAAGLLVAIPVLVAYQVLMGRIDGAAAELDAVAVEWIENDGGLVGVSTTPHLGSSVAESASISSAPAIALAAGA